MVVVFHSSLYINDGRPIYDPVSKAIFAVLSYFWLGVPLFFVISGYCISAACDSMRRRPKGVKEYFYRRFRRILPPYWGALALAGLMVFFVTLLGWPGLFADQNHAVNLPSTLTFWQWLGSATLAEQWRFHFVGGPPLQALGTAWTLCYEEQFYAVCGAMLFLRAQRFFLSTLLLTLAIVPLAIVNFSFSTHPFDGFFFDGYWLQFAVGIALYYCLNYANKEWFWRVRICFATALAGAMLLLSRDPTGVSLGLCVSIIFAQVAFELHPFDEQLSGSKVCSPVRACGLMCYSLYLVHWPIVKLFSHGLFLLGVRSPWQTLLITLPVCMALSLGAAIVFFRFIESHFLSATQRAVAQAASTSFSRHAVAAELSR